MIVCGTGHRPEYYKNKSKDELDKIRHDLRTYLIDNNVTRVISGMARGWDLILAEEAINQGIEVYCYIPFPKQHRGWSKLDQEKYNWIIGKASLLMLVCKKYEQGCYHKRNKKMVDASEKVLAFYNNEVKFGGTYYTVNYALKNRKPVENFWDSADDKSGV